MDSIFCRIQSVCSSSLQSTPHLNNRAHIYINKDVAALVRGFYAVVRPRLLNSGGKISNNEQHTHNFNFIKQLEISYNLLKAFSYLMTKEEKLNR